MCRVGVSDEGRCSFTAIRLSKNGKWGLNKVCTMPWCHAAAHFEVQMSPFEPFFRTIVLTVEAHLQSRQCFLYGDFQCVTQD